ncbi:BREX system P-loop protein BrxC [Streptomyces sp. NPDC086182]|uniref:BREX system P-loop protein BrxC n=1 Tax=Streptomyces sp. NPDC086182 TaxID=3155058 RepID=UPI00342C23D7
MLLGTIFAKDVQRPIEGVIKADDTSHLATEVEEYVLTNEAAKGLETLLEEYTDYQHANGVWISGFFGSGKSHLLKMLAHLLGDVDGQDFTRVQVAAAFRSKAAADNAFLAALLDKADRIGAYSLLFNIDQKADVISKDQEDALLQVFVKVFNEHRGYYGKQGHVARFERDLDRNGQLEDFKAAYQSIAGKPWNVGREESVLQEFNISQAYAEVSGQTEGRPTGILAKYRQEHSVSIEDFAEEIKDWLDAREDPQTRLNFFVDEVGQFIGTNSRLMLNLQTIAEALNSKCNGRAWVFVTSQEDMEKVIGDRTRSQSHDFSKIQARFKTRLKLTSADVEEVIRKRLLRKNEQGAAVLEGMYAEQHPNFRTLFDFVEGTTYRNYPGEDSFVGTYPFVTYQFPLFQSAIQGISDHNYFEGRSSSVGERSMLGVVQEVAKELGGLPIGSLATFDQMYSGIRAALKSATQRVIARAEQNLPENQLAMRLLKALFLVKHVEGFVANPHNLTVLITDGFDRDIAELTRQVKVSLDLLETENYIQRAGTVYAFLTNDEQEMEAEIKNVDIEPGEVKGRLFKILSENVVRLNKVRYAKNNQDFAFSYKLDDQPYSRNQQADLTLHCISPDYEYDFDVVKAHSAGRDELRVVLGDDAQAMGDLQQVIRTEKYIKRRQTTSLSASQQQVLQAKAAQNIERTKDVIERLRTMVGKARLVINTAEVPVTSGDAEARVREGMQELITRTYTSLQMLGGVRYQDNQIQAAANPEEQALFDAEGLSKLDVPAGEVLSHVTRRGNKGEQVTVKALVDRYSTKPFGWDLPSIEVVIAHLVGTSKLTLSMDGATLKRTEIPRALSNTQKHSHILVSQQKTFEARKVKDLQTFAKDFFDEPTVPGDPLELGRYVADNLQKKRAELASYQEQQGRYPFLAGLDGPVALLQQAVGKGEEWYLTDFPMAEDLLDAKDEQITPVVSFFKGAQRGIYDSARDFLQTNSTNLGYLEADATGQIQALLDDENLLRGGKITKLKQAVEGVQAQVAARVEQAVQEVAARITDRVRLLQETSDYQQATDAARQKADQTVKVLLDRIAAANQIATINMLAGDFADTGYPALLDSLTSSTPQPEPEQNGASDNSGSGAAGGRASTPVPVPVKHTTVSIKHVKVNGGPTLLESPQDVDAYLDALRQALITTIDSGKRVVL